LEAPDLEGRDDRVAPGERIGLRDRGVLSRTDDVAIPGDHTCDELAVSRRAVCGVGVDEVPSASAAHSVSSAAVDLDPVAAAFSVEPVGGRSAAEEICPIRTLDDPRLGRSCEKG
jgi:hypothetical protein